MKLCIDCKHFIPDGGGCRKHPLNVYLMDIPVYGEEMAKIKNKTRIYDFASVMRGQFGHLTTCGPEAREFEPKEPVPPSTSAGDPKNVLVRLWRAVRGVFGHTEEALRK